jgi:DNA-binding MarR family transcriptional regulator
MEQRARAVELFRRANRFMRAGDLGDVAVGELTVAQLRVLFRLRNHGPITSGQLAGGLGVTLPTVTSVIDRLVRQGLVERRDDPNDRRRVIVAVTAGGQALVERIQQGRRARLAQAIESLGADDVDHLVAGLEALAAAADYLEATTAPEPAEALESAVG